MSKYITLLGYCSTTKKPMGIQFQKEQEGFAAVGSFAMAPSDSCPDSGEEYTGKLYSGATFKCKHCQNNHILHCDSCGTVMCVANKQESVVCPKCGRSINIRWVEDISELDDNKIKSDNQ